METITSSEQSGDQEALSQAILGSYDSSEEDDSDSDDPSMHNPFTKPDDGLEVWMYRSNEAVRLVYGHDRSLSRAIKDGCCRRLAVHGHSGYFVSMKKTPDAAAVETAMDVEWGA